MQLQYHPIYPNVYDRDEDNKVPTHRPHITQIIDESDERDPIPPRTPRINPDRVARSYYKNTDDIAKEPRWRPNVQQYRRRRKSRKSRRRRSRKSRKSRRTRSRKSRKSRKIKA